MIDFNFRTGGALPSGLDNVSRDKTNPARVIDIILDSDHPLYDQYDGPNSIGMIFYRLIDETNLDNSETGEEEYTGQAFPISSYQKLLPLKNEIVFLTKGPDGLVDDGSGEGKYYYITPYAIWNHPHHNAIPVRTEDNPEVNIGENLTPDDKVAPLQPFPGDMILEGRLGQTIRFAGLPHPKSPFTDSTNENKPIFIISNGQGETENGFMHIIEDINKDPSSIFLTSNHKIPLELANNKRLSYDDIPDTPNKYQGPQILFNADRLVLNARKNDILLSSSTSIGLNSNTVNIDGQDYMCIDADKIYLGTQARTAKGASKQPAVLGHRLEAYLEDILDQLQAMAKAMGRAKTIKGDAIPTINLRGKSSQIVLKQLKRQLNPKGRSNLKSKKLYIE
tara:strand:+ start:1145 stop:2323 length:1179 start_codon:yes stop_codon:yes gene_type:complete